MTTNTETVRFTTKTLVKIATMLVSTFAIIGAIVYAAGAAHAAPVVTVKSGDMVNDASLLGFLPSGLCGMLAGTDANTGRKVGLTMGHCSSAGNNVNTNWFTPVGRVEHATFNVTAAQQVNRIDVGVIRFNSNVRVIPSGHRVARPKPQTNVAMGGYGLWSPRVGHGKITQVYDTDFRVSIAASPGNSGGMISQGNTIYGLVSRGFKDYTSPDTVVMRMDVILDFIETHFGVKLINF